ncbi:MAG TPA: YihY/virulence factor BrkB family protein [Flavobacteriaceae bacterium]|nr:YihY/virulence factor BrkB family protein [Flavobacteriaceae bacterium]
MKEYVGLITRTIKQWLKNKPFQQSAVIAYYTLFSLPGLLMIVISIAGYFFGKSTVQDRIIQQLAEFIGTDAAITIEQLISNISIESSSSLMLLISIGSLVFGATGAFFQLKKAMNRIWNVREKKSSVLMMLINRMISLGIVLVIGFMLMISLVIHAIVIVLGDYLAQFAPSLSALGLELINFFLSFLFIACLFAAIFKLLPDIKIRWKVTFVGASFTTILFLFAVYGLGIYFGKSNPTSVFGGASSLILIMLWVYYSCLILFLGAEFTVQYALFKNYKIGLNRFSEPAIFQKMEELKEEQRLFEKQEELFHAYKKKNKR